MNRSIDQDLKEIERRESHLWLATLGLLILFVFVTLGACYLLLTHTDIELNRNLLLGGLLGVSGLVLLFCGYVWYTRSKFRRVRRLFEAQAMRDSLTGLLNRQSFPDRFAQEVARADREQAMLGILLCDLDNFKRINDTHGHPVGDQMLERTAEAILRATRGTDLVFRWGGDEILVILSPTAREGALRVAARVRAEIERVKERSGYPLDISIGVALYPEHSTDLDELIGLADKALYFAKRAGDKVHVGEEELPIDAAAVEFVFQPVVDSRSNRTIGHEILSRDPTGTATIQELFRRYEAVGQLTDFKRMVFEGQVRAAEELNLERVFVNVDLALLESLRPVAKPDGVEVVLEISENETVPNWQRYIDVVEIWRQHGFKFAIDDFGSGLMSLPFVAQLLPSFIKMDRSAIIEAGASKQFSGFLRDMVSAMRNYSQQGIIAEGVETAAELKVVNDLGVHKVQGHFTGRPRPLEPDTPEPVDSTG